MGTIPSEQVRRLRVKGRRPKLIEVLEALLAEVANWHIAHPNMMD
jgi:hypothetical protein